MTDRHAPGRGASERRVLSWLFPGDRDVWRIGAALLVPGVVFLGWFVLKPREYLTGSTSTYTRSPVVGLPKGSELCLPRLTLPKDTRRIQLDLGGADGRPPALVTFRPLLSRPTQTRIPRGESSTFTRVTAAAPEFEPGARSMATGALCVRALGEGLTVGGMTGVAADSPPPTVDGQPLHARVSAWFLPAAGSTKSLAEQFPEIARRAALFRPAPIGPWTYWVIFLAGMPLMAWLSLRALADPRSRRVAVTIAVVGVVSGGSWAVITSPFDSPDESEHFAALQYVAETGSQVDRTVGQRSPYSTEQVNLLEALRHFSTIESADGKKPWLTSQAEAFRSLEARGPPVDNGGGGTVTTSAGNTAYYVLIAPSYLVAKSGGVLATLLAGRFTSTLFLLVIAFCALGTVRELFPSRRRLAVGAALLVLLAPVLSFLGGAINTDMGVNAADALLIYLVIRAMRRGATPLVTAAIAFVAAIAVLIKATAFALVPAAIVGVIVALYRAGRGALAATAALLAGLGLGIAVKYAIQAFLGQPAAGAGAPTPGPPAAAALRPGPILSYTWQTFFPRLPGMADYWVQRWPFFNIYIERGFGAFGWYAYEMPRVVLKAIAAGMTGVLGCGLFTAFKRRDDVWKYKWEILVLMLVVVGVLGGVATAYYTDTPRPVPGEQGRYGFPTAVAVAPLAVGSLIGFGPRARRWILVGGVVAMGTLGVLGRLVYLAGAYT